jgi:hypothetical protein
VMMLLAAGFEAAGAPPQAMDPEPSLKLALEGDWSELIVSEMINHGGKAPVYAGLRITRSSEGLSISPWQEDETAPGLTPGTARPYDASLLPKFIDFIMGHYTAAVASKDIYEHIAELEDAKERKKAWAGAAYVAGGIPAGGFGSAGIDVRITTRGRQVRFENSFGDKSAKDFWRWLMGNGAIWPTEFDAAGSPLQADTPEEALRNALEKDWSELIVSAMIDQGCVARIYFGLQITRTSTGLSISTWQENHNKPKRGLSLGAAKPFDASLLPKFIDSIVQHCVAALASKDIHEHIAELKDPEEKEKAWAGAIYVNRGLPVGGFGAEGIDVRIRTNGQGGGYFAHSFGDAGFGDLCEWLMEHGASWK